MITFDHSRDKGFINKFLNGIDHRLRVSNGLNIRYPKPSN